MTAEQFAAIKRCWGRVAVEMTDTANELKRTPHNPYNALLKEKLNILKMDYAALTELINENSERSS